MQICRFHSGNLAQAVPLVRQEKVFKAPFWTRIGGLLMYNSSVALGEGLAPERPTFGVHETAFERSGGPLYRAG
jgi:hypothetical protein